MRVNNFCFKIFVKIQQKQYVNKWYYNTSN